MPHPWYKISNETAVPTPAILLFPERIRYNIQQMIAIAGDVKRLRPHVKTHKLPQVIQMQVEAGITRFKCATVSEANMVAANGGQDILIAYPLYGPAIGQLFQLIKTYPNVRFSTLADNAEQVQLLENQAKSSNTPLDVFLDLDVGMERTGIKPGLAALTFYQQLTKSTWLRPRGLHAYDGHIHMADPEQREATCKAAFQPVLELIENLKTAGIPLEEIICGGTPTLLYHAVHAERTLSSGTVLLWDWGYASKFSDLAFQHAAVIIARIISKPGQNKLCLDLGHKALASEMVAPRVHFFDLPPFEMVGHSEEHMVISFEGADQFSVGDCLSGIPIHICPTMALHDWVWVVENGEAKEKWPVTARTRAVTLSTQKVQKTT